MFLTKVVEKIKTCILCSVTFRKNCAISEIIWKNIVEMDRPQMTMWCMHIACRIPRQQHTLRIYSTYCFSTTTVVAQMYITVVFCIHFLSYSIYFHWNFCSQGNKLWFIRSNS